MSRGLLLVLAVGALGTCARAPDAPAPAPPSAASALFPLMRELHALLEKDHLTVGAVVAQVGSIARDPGQPQPMELRPRAPGLKGATLSQYPRGVIYILELAFTPEARPTLGELRGLFGDDLPLVIRLHGERTTIFSPRGKGRHWSVAVIADASRCFDAHSSAEPPGPCEKLQAATRIETVAFRRDPVE